VTPERREALARLRGGFFAVERGFVQLGRAARAAAAALGAAVVTIQPITIERGSDHAADE